MEYVVFTYVGYKVRHWMPKDKQAVCEIVQKCLQSYGLHFEPEGEDIDVVDVENYYIKDDKGQFWVVIDEATNKIVGTAAYYEVIDSGQSHCQDKRPNAVEIRKMYLLPEARGKKLGWSLLKVYTYTYMCVCVCVCMYICTYIYSKNYILVFLYQRLHTQ